MVTDGPIPATLFIKQIFQMDISGAVVSPENLEDISTEILKLIKDKEKYKEVIRELRDKYIFSFGQSAEIGAKHIINIIGINNH